MKRSIYILSVFVIMAFSCKEHNATPDAGQLNSEASLPASFNFSQRGFKVITSTINKQKATMSTLYGNDSAKATAQLGNGKCLPGSVFALVTWKQQPDKRWIGANMPGELLSVEMLKATNETPTYIRFKDTDLKMDPDTSGQSARSKYILGLKPSIMF